MKHIDCYFDFISPYAYLAFEKLPQALEGLSYAIGYKPVLFAALLKHHGQLGPAEIAPKRDWTYRQVEWHGHANGIPFDMTATHPFNPLPLLRLALACGEGRTCNRYVVETIMRHVWRGGQDAADVQRYEALKQQLQPKRDPNGDAVKADLKANGDEALALNLFGVPSFVVDGKVFWGFDSLPILRAYLEGDAWFDAKWDAAATRPVGISRTKPAS